MKIAIKFGRKLIILDEVTVALRSWELEMKPDIKNHNKNGNSLNVGTEGRSKDRNQKSKSRIGYTKIRCYTFHEESHIWRSSPKRN